MALVDFAFQILSVPCMLEGAVPRSLLIFVLARVAQDSGDC